MPKDLWSSGIWRSSASSQHQVYAEAHNVMTISSFGWEIDTWQIAEHSCPWAKSIRAGGAEQSQGLVARRFTSRKLFPAAFGILEPGPEAPTATLKS